MRLFKKSMAGVGVALAVIIGMPVAQASTPATANTTYSCPQGTLNGSNCVIDGALITPAVPAVPAVAPSVSTSNPSYPLTYIGCYSWKGPHPTDYCSEGYGSTTYYGQCPDGSWHTRGEAFICETLTGGTPAQEAVPAVYANSTTVPARSTVTYSCPSGQNLVVQSCLSQANASIIDPSDLFSHIKGFITGSLLVGAVSLFTIGLTIRLAFKYVKKKAQ